MDFYMLIASRRLWTDRQHCRCHVILMGTTIEDDSDRRPSYVRRTHDPMTDFIQGIRAPPSFCQRGDQVIRRRPTFSVTLCSIRLVCHHHMHRCIRAGSIDVDKEHSCSRNSTEIEI